MWPRSENLGLIILLSFNFISKTAIFFLLAWNLSEKKLLEWKIKMFEFTMKLAYKWKLRKWEIFMQNLFLFYFYFIFLCIGIISKLRPIRLSFKFTLWGWGWFSPDLKFTSQCANSFVDDSSKPISRSYFPLTKTRCYFCLLLGCPLKLSQWGNIFFFFFFFFFWGL